MKCIFYRYTINILLPYSCRIMYIEIYSINRNIIPYLDKDIPTNNYTYEVFILNIDKKREGYIIITEKNKKYVLEHFFINDTYRNRGFGKLLLQRCLESYKKIELMVSVNNTIAIHIYIKCGFNISRTIKNYKVMTYSSAE